jgi:hypothetical protein
MAEQTENLASLPPPSPTLPQGKGRMSMSDILGFQKPFLERKTALQQEITKAEGDELKAKQAQTELLAQQTLNVEQQTAQQEQAARQAYKTAVENQPLPAFIPTQDNARDLAGMFSLINVMGVLLGGGGKQAAVGALGAMNGMLEGYQKGRADLYKKERDLFDKNFKVMQQKHAELRREMEDAIKLAATDRQAGMAAAQLAAAKAGSSILQAQLRKGQLVGGYKIVEEASAGAKRLEDYKLKREEQEAREVAANERARLQREQQTEQARLQREQQLKLAEIRARAPTKAEKTPADVEKAVRQNALFLDNITDIVAEADALIKSGKIRGIGVIQGKIPYDVAQLYMTTEERNFLQNFNALTNQKLKDQSGATVTGAEFARQRGVLPLRDDEPNVVLDKLRNWRRLIAQETAVVGKAYPSVITKYGIVLDLPKDKSRLVPGLEYNTPKGKLLWDGASFVSPNEEED